MKPDDITRELLKFAPSVIYWPKLFEGANGFNWQTWNMGKVSSGPDAYANTLYVRSDVDMDGVDWESVLEECEDAFNRGPSTGNIKINKPIQVT